MQSRRTIEMLKPVKLDQRKEDESFEVERILAHRQAKNGYKYLVKWKNYGNQDNSWISNGDFNGKKIIKSYWKDKQRSSKKKKEDKLEERSPSRNLTFGLGGSHVREQTPLKRASRRGEAQREAHQK